MRRTYVRLRLFAGMMASCLLLTACASREISSASENVVYTLPPASAPYAAPVGSEGLQYTAAVPLYLPAADGQHLLARPTELQFTHGQRTARETTVALFAAHGDDQVRALGAEADLRLSGVIPVETSCGVCTVDIASTALSMDYSELYTVQLALASTLSGMNGVRYVNLLVAGQAASFNVAGSLPSGAVTAHPGEELPVLWEQLSARQAPLGEDPADQAFSAAATLYFPLADGSGFLPEVRTLTFPGQTPTQLAVTLLTTLSGGARYLNGTCELPDIPSLLTTEPLISELTEGGRLITLYFSSLLWDRLKAAQIDAASFLGAVNWTLTTFIPAVGAVRCYVGSDLIASVSGKAAGTIVFEDGLQRRREFRELLCDQISLYLASGSRLTRVTRNVPAENASDPATVLYEMMQGPTEEERAAGVRAVLPSGLDRTDILGISVTENTILIHLSPRFERLIRRQTMNERLLCYAMVNTLGEILGRGRVRFFFNGAVPEKLDGELYWGGEFLCNSALVKPSES